MAVIEALFKKLKAEKFFLVVSLLFGLAFILLVPPFQVPDEPSHFYRAWQISEGTFSSVQDNHRVGGHLPAGVLAFTDVFSHMIWVTTEFYYDAPHVNNALAVKLNSEQRVFIDFNNTALYSAICYAPAALAMFLLRAIDLPILYIFYGARLANLIFCIFIFHYTIKRLPAYKWLFTLLTLLPMTIFVSASLSADAFTNAICFLFIGSLIRFMFEYEIMNWCKYQFMGLLVVAVVSVKAVYAPLILIMILLPVQKFKSRSVYYLSLFVFFLLAVIAAYFWSSQTSDLYISHENYNSDYRAKAALVAGADMQKQLEQIKNNGLYIFEVIFSSLSSSFNMYFYGYIGVFGWLTLPLPNWLVYCMYACIIVVAIFERKEDIIISAKHKLVFASVFVGILFLVFLSQHLIWNPVGGDKILNIQGRYLIPFAPLFFLCFTYNKSRNNYLPAIITCVCTLLALFYSVFLLQERYFGIFVH